MKPFFNLFKYRNFKINNLFKQEILLGRWNYKNKEKYMIWGNYDNCFVNPYLKKTKEPNKN